MVDPFFIIGLPRSRTAWISAFMTYDGIHCYHEGINGCNTIQEYKDKIGNDSDSSTGLMILDLKKHFPDRKILIIDSTPYKAIKFMKDVYGVDDPEWFYYLRERLLALDGLRVNVNDINDRLQEIWEYLADTPYDKKRGDLMKKLNIQVDPHSMDEEAIKRLLSEL